MDHTTVCRESSAPVCKNSIPIDGTYGRCKLLTRKGKMVLDKENFRSVDFWRGYKLYCFARYSHCRRSQRQFLTSKMGRVVIAIFTGKHVAWGSLFDESIREVWAQMEEYGEVFHGQDWKNLRLRKSIQQTPLASRDLMEEFDDVKKLSASEKGCLLMQVVENDEHGTERLHKESQAIEVARTNVFDEIRGMLNRARSNLENLRQSSREAVDFPVNHKRKRSVTVLS